MRVLLFCEAEPERCRLAALLSTGFQIDVTASWAEAHSAAASTSSAVLVVPYLDDAGVRDAVQAFRHRHPWCPIVLCTTFHPRSARYLAALRVEQAVFLELDESDLPAAVQRARMEASFEKLSKWIAECGRFAPVLRRALVLACREEFVAVGTGHGKDAPELEPHRVLVQSLARRMGCSPNYLSWAARRGGIRLAVFLRWIIFLRGLFLMCRAGCTGQEVAVYSGFSSSSSWSHFVRRLTGKAPTQLEGTSFDDWCFAFLLQSFADSSVFSGLRMG